MVKIHQQRSLNVSDDRPSCVEKRLSSTYSRLSSDYILVVHERIQCVMLTGKFKPVFHNLGQVAAAFCFGFKLAMPC